MGELNFPGIVSIDIEREHLLRQGHRFHEIAVTSYVPGPVPADYCPG